MLADAMELVDSRYTEFSDEYDTELPNHGFETLVSNVSQIGESLADERMSDAAGIEYDDDTTTKRLEGDVVDVLLSVATVAYEHDLAVADAFEERLRFMREWMAFEDALRDVDDPSQSEVSELMDEHLSDESMEQYLDAGTDVGENVDMDMYNHDDTNVGYQ